jgi:hypothetical protein
LNPVESSQIQNKLQEFLKFVQKNSEQYFNLREYIPAVDALNLLVDKVELKPINMEESDHSNGKTELTLEI